MRTLLLAAAATLALATPVAAQQLVESYQARLGVDDHYNSNGVRLRDAAAIIRQDRANFHAFGLRDDEDESDGFFSSKANRARLEAMVRGGRMDRFTRNAIVNGEPLVQVEVYRNFVVVTVAR